MSVEQNKNMDGPRGKEMASTKNWLYPWLITFSIKNRESKIMSSFEKVWHVFFVLRFCQFYCITRLSWTRHLVLYVDYLKWLSLFFMWNIKICFMLITLFNLFPHPPPEHTIQPSKQSNKENIDGFGFRWSNPAVYTLLNINFSHNSSS